MSLQFYRLALEKVLFPSFFPRIKRIGMKAGYVVVTPLIVIMKVLVEHLNKIGVAAAMMGEDVDEAVKSGTCEIVY